MAEEADADSPKIEHERDHGFGVAAPVGTVELRPDDYENPGRPLRPVSVLRGYRPTGSGALTRISHRFISDGHLRCGLGGLPGMAVSPV